MHNQLCCKPFSQLCSHSRRISEKKLKITGFARGKTSLEAEGLGRKLYSQLRGINAWKTRSLPDTASNLRAVLGWQVGISKLWTARSRLYRSRFSRPNTHFSVFFKIYKKIIFSRANSGNFCQKIGKFCKILTFFGKFRKILQNFQ